MCLSLLATVVQASCRAGRAAAQPPRHAYAAAAGLEQWRSEAPDRHQLRRHVLRSPPSVLLACDPPPGPPCAMSRAPCAVCLSRACGRRASGPNILGSECVRQARAAASVLTPARAVRTRQERTAKKERASQVQARRPRSFRQNRQGRLRRRVAGEVLSCAHAHRRRAPGPSPPCPCV